MDEPFQQDAWDKVRKIVEDRVASRFLKPVRILKEHPQSADLGFGFAMLALDCLLIDALQAFRDGRTSGKETRTTKAFIDFLRQRPRFMSEFSQAGSLARLFVDNVRNGLLHDGETRDGWRVLKASQDGRMIEKGVGGWILYRDAFHDALEQEFQDYLTELATPGPEIKLRRNFLLRMDSICDILPERKVKLYFAYGSNMNQEQMAERIAGAANVLGIARLPKYRIVFNKRSIDGSGKANIIHDKEASHGVEGILLGSLKSN